MIASRSQPKFSNKWTFKSSFKKFHKLLHKLYTFPSSEASFPLSIHNMAAGCFTRFNYVLFVGHIHYSLKLFFFSRVIRDSSCEKRMLTTDVEPVKSWAAQNECLFEWCLSWRLFIDLFFSNCDQIIAIIAMSKRENSLLLFFLGACNGNWWEVIKIGLKWNLKCFKNKYWHFFSFYVFSLIMFFED